jgi:uncharacterized membrane protein
MLNKLSQIAPEKWFLGLSLFFGVIFVFLSPINYPPDEMAHFTSAYIYSEGKFDSIKEGEIPSEYINIFKDLIYIHKLVSKGKLLEHLSSPFQWDSTGKPDSPAYVTSYFPLNYFPQALGIFIFKQLGFSPIYRFFAGRLLNLVLWILLVYFSIKYLPIGKWVLLLISLSPMCLFLAASFSADPLLYGQASLYISLLLYIRANPKPVTALKWLFFGSAILLSIIKGGFLFPYLALSIMLPYQFFTSRKSKYIYIISLVFICSVLLISWINWSNQNGYHGGPLWKVDPIGQMQWIINNPIQYVNVIIATIRIFGIEFLKMIVGVLGWLDTYLPTYIYFLFYILLIMAYVSESNPMLLSGKEKILIFLVAATETIAIMTSIYLTWTSVGTDVILGIQGRYFLPILFIFIISIFPSRNLLSKYFPSGLIPVILVLGVILIMVNTVIIVADHNYLWQNVLKFSIF